jgi:hypothetical protein
MTQQEASQINLGTEIAAELRRVSEEVALCRRIVAQARDQFISFEIGAQRAAEATA